MGSRSTASYNPTLTNYAVGLAGSIRTPLGFRMAPRCVVPSATGQYKSWDDTNTMMIVPTARALGGPSTRLAFSATDPGYNCTPHSLEAPIDDHELNEAGTNARLLEQAKTRAVVVTAARSFESRVLAVAHAKTAVSGVGAWSSPDVDPIDECNGVIVDLTKVLGMHPNRCTISVDVLQQIHKHPKVKARLPNNVVQSLSPTQFAAMLLFGDIQVSVQETSYETAKRGQTSSKAFLAAGDIYFYYAEDTPTQYDASWLKTFSTAESSIDSVETYREEGTQSTIVRVKWTEQVLETCSRSGARIAVT